MSNDVIGGIKSRERRQEEVKEEDGGWWGKGDRRGNAMSIYPLGIVIQF